MKRMSTAKKVSSNRLTATRTRKDLKRRKHVRILRIAGDKINSSQKQLEKLMYLREKYSKITNVPPTAKVL